MAELVYKKLKKDLEQKAIVSADPATTAMVVTKSEFIGYKDQTQQTLNQMTAATTKAQEGVNNLVQGKTPVKGLVVYREDIADNNGIAITENRDSNLAIYKVNSDGSPSDVKLLLNNKEVAMKSDLSSYVDVTSEQTISGVKTFTQQVNIDGSRGLYIRDSNGNISLNIYSGSPRTDKSYFAQRGSDGRSRTYSLNYNGPTSEDDLVNKQYVDKSVANCVTTNTQQTITANKTLTNHLIFQANNIKAADIYQNTTMGSLVIDAGYRGVELTGHLVAEGAYFGKSVNLSGGGEVSTQNIKSNTSIVNKEYVDSKSAIDETTNQWLKTGRTYKGKPVYKLIATTDINFTTGVGVENWVFRNLPNVPVSVPTILTCKTIIVYGSWEDLTQGTQIAENVLHTTQFSISAYYNQVLNSVRAVLTSGSLPEKKNMTFTFIMEVA